MSSRARGRGGARGGGRGARGGAAQGRGGQGGGRARGGGCGGGSGPLDGYVFVCSNETEQHCLSLGLLGAGRGALKEMERIKPTTRIFLFNFQSFKLFGFFQVRTLDRCCWLQGCSRVLPVAAAR